jgi:uroporphyrinogen-III synthase
VRAIFSTRSIILVGDDSLGGLRGKRVVVTRATGQSDDLVRDLEAKGAVAVILPLVAFGPADNLTDLDEGILQLDRFDWILLTSQNSLRALEQRCQALRLDLSARVGNARVAVVGPATAEAVKKAGIEVAYIAKKHQGVSLAQELASEVKGKRVFLPRSDRANPELVKRLQQLDATVKEVVAYRTVSPDQAAFAKVRATLEQGADAILFFSPSAVHHLQQLLGNERVLELSRQLIFAAIGPVTDRALRAAHVERILLAEDTTSASVVNTLAKYFSTIDPGRPAGVNSA